MLEHMDSRELTEWSLLWEIKADEREAEKTGGIIDHGPRRRADPDDEDDDADDEDDIPEGEPDWLTVPSPKPE
jgi:hypothetical protein